MCLVPINRSASQRLVMAICGSRSRQTQNSLAEAY
jgi:hypothetical protein